LLQLLLGGAILHRLGLGQVRRCQKTRQH
jgi:hypothetical protein